MSGTYKKWIFSKLPKSDFVDLLINYMHFVLRHKRIPKKRVLRLADQLFYIKTSRESLDPLRVLTSDKELVKNYVEYVVGAVYNVPTIKVFRSESDRKSVV